MIYLHFIRTFQTNLKKNGDLKLRNKHTKDEANKCDLQMLHTGLSHYRINWGTKSKEDQGNRQLLRNKFRSIPQDQRLS